MPLSYVASNNPKHRLSSDSRRWILSPSRPNSSSWHHSRGMDGFGHGQVASLTKNWQPACETGDCDGRLQCNGLIGKPPATLIQVALQGDKGKPNFYDEAAQFEHSLDIEQEEIYTIGMEILV
ncbi:hypothetical protein V6N13_122502 [Hibiscus sabdariffa]